MTTSTRVCAALMVAACITTACESPSAPLMDRSRMLPGGVAKASAVSDGGGKVWRQLTETTGLSFAQVAETCPTDGASLCTGVVGGRDLRGWIWATGEQVTGLLAQYEPGLLASPTVSGFEQFFTAGSFFGSFRPTFSYALTYQAGQHASGWTSSTDASGAPVAASVTNGHNSVSVSGSFDISSVVDATEVSGLRGVYLYHPSGSGPIDASNDEGSTNPSGGLAIATVLANDSFAGEVASLTTLTLTQLSSSDPSVTLDPVDGSIHVAAGASVGVKRLDYSLCETATPTNCDIAAVTVTVVPYAIEAVDDAGSAVSTLDRVAIDNVLANDRFNGAPATLESVTLSLVSTTSAGITLDAATGSVAVAAGMPGGTQTLVYRICEAASPSNCGQATARVTVIPQTIVVSTPKVVVKEGDAGTFTVRLGQEPTSDVVISLALSQGTAPVTASPSTLTFGVANWNVPVAVTFRASLDPDRYNNAASINLTAPGVATVPVVVQVVDVDQPAHSPMAMLDAPLNGQTISGTVEFSGTGTDDNGQVVEARFSVDGNGIYKDRRTATTFRVAGGWNSRTVANGWHTLEFRVIDNSGNDGRMLIKVLVNN